MQDRDRFTLWLLALVEVFHQDNLSVFIQIPVNNRAYDYINIGKIADTIIIKAYNEHSLPGIPGPVS